MPLTQSDIIPIITAIKQAEIKAIKDIQETISELLEKIKKEIQD